jgi:hypothetical protein
MNILVSMVKVNKTLVFCVIICTSTTSFAGRKEKRLLSVVKPRMGLGGNSLVQVRPSQTLYSTHALSAPQNSTTRVLSEDATSLKKTITPPDSGERSQFRPLLIPGTAAAAALGVAGAAAYYSNHDSDESDVSDQADSKEEVVPSIQVAAIKPPADKDAIEKAMKTIKEFSPEFNSLRDKKNFNDSFALIAENLKYYPELYDFLADVVSSGHYLKYPIRALAHHDISHPKITEAIFAKFDKPTGTRGISNVEIAFPYILNAARSDSNIWDRYTQSFDEQTKSTGFDGVGNNLSDNENLRFKEKRGKLYTYFKNNFDVSKLPKNLDDNLKKFAIKFGIPDLLVHTDQEIDSNDYFKAIKNEIAMNHYEERIVTYDGFDSAEVWIDHNLFKSIRRKNGPSHIKKFIEKQSLNEAAFDELLQLARTSEFPEKYISELVQSLESLDHGHVSNEIKGKVATLQIQFYMKQLRPKLVKRFPDESKSESVLLTFPEHKQALKGTKLDEVKRMTLRNSEPKTKIVQALHQSSAENEQSLFESLLLARPDSGSVVRQEVEKYLTSIFTKSQNKPELVSILNKNLKNRDLKIRYFALDLLKRFSPKSVPPASELEKIMDVYSPQERDGWKLSDPAHHNPKKYLYLVHGITPPDDGHWVGRFHGKNAFEDPKAFVEREFICTSLVTNEKNRTFRPTGVILDMKGTIIENIVIAESYDFGSNGYFFPRSNKIDSAQHIADMIPVDRYSEIIINGTNRVSKKQIEISGVFINGGATNLEVKEARQVARRLGVPIVDFRKSN